MKIALVIGKYDAYGGGAERWTDRHARMLLTRGHEIHLVARSLRGAPDDATCHVVDTGKTAFQRRLRFGRNAETMLRRLGCDVVHDMGDSWYADLFMPHHGTRRGSFKHSIRYLPPAMQRARLFAKQWVPRYREFRALERRQYEPGSNRLFLAVSEMIRDHMMLYCHAPRDRIRVVHNGVDVDRFQPATDDGVRNRVRSDLGVESDPLFLIVAHNFKLKGLDTLLQATAALTRQKKAARVVVVGGGSVGHYQAMARSLGCLDRVRFVGDQMDPIPYYQAADVFVLPTFYDPCSLVVLEAMASSLPIITSRHNGVHELMQPEREGSILSDPSDSAALTTHMERYLDPAVRREAGMAARALAERNSLDLMVRKYIDIYEEIIHGAPATAPAASPAGA